MINFNPTYTAKDYEDYANDAAKFRQELDLMDTFMAGASEGWDMGPTGSISAWVQSGFGSAFAKEETGGMRGADLNDKYGLAGTEVALEDDEIYTENHAKIVLERHLTERQNASIAQQVSEEEGTLGTITNFAGALGIGFVDPVNILAGVGTAAATMKFGALAKSNMFADVIASRGAGNILARNLMENLAVTSAFEFTATELGETAYNKEISAEQKAMTILAGTVLGGVIGTPLELRAYKQVRQLGYASEINHGSKTADMNADINAKNAADAANGIKPNPDHVVELHARDQFATRPHQTNYQFIDLGAPKVMGMTQKSQIHSRTWSIGRNIETGKLDQVSIHGDGTITLTDNYNLAHNRVESVLKRTPDAKAKGEVFRLELNENTKILTRQEFPEIREQLTEALSKKIDQSKASDKAKAQFKSKVKDAVDDATGVVELNEALHSVLDDFEGIPKIANITNAALKDLGFDGFHHVAEVAGKTVSAKHNTVTLFPKKYLDADSLKLKKTKAKGENPYAKMTDLELEDAIKYKELKTFKKTSKKGERGQYDVFRDGKLVYLIEKENMKKGADWVVYTADGERLIGQPTLARAKESAKSYDKRIALDRARQEGPPVKKAKAKEQTKEEVIAEVMAGISIKEGLEQADQRFDIGYFQGRQVDDLLSVKESKATRNAFAATSDEKNMFYNPTVFKKVYNGEQTTPFNNVDPRNAEFIKPFQAMEKAEVLRRNDPKQKIGVSQQALDEMAKNKRPSLDEGYDPTSVFTEADQLALNEMRAKRTSMAGKKNEAYSKSVRDAMDKIDNPKLIEEAYFDYINCRGFNVR